MDKITPGPWCIDGGDGLEISAYLPGKSKEDIKTKQFYYVPVAIVKYGEWQDKKWLINKEEYQTIARAIATLPELIEACKAIVRDFEDKDDPLTVPASSCIHVPNHTDLCPYWLAKQALAKIEGDKP